MRCIVIDSSVWNFRFRVEALSRSQSTSDCRTILPLQDHHHHHLKTYQREMMISVSSSIASERHLTESKSDDVNDKLIRPYLSSDDDYYLCLSVCLSVSFSPCTSFHYLISVLFVEQSGDLNCTRLRQLLPSSSIDHLSTLTKDVVDIQPIFIVSPIDFKRILSLLHVDSLVLL
jgi:hypothetical protein